MTKQQFLFGEADQVYNTLSTEATIIKEEMKAVQKRINAAETVLAILNNRKQEIEAAMGISRRIPAIPKDFELHFTYVMLAHRKAIPKRALFGKKPEFNPGIFSIFLPTAIEIICDGSESEKEIKRYRERGLTPVIVKRRPSIDDYDSDPEDHEQFMGALMKGS